MDLMQADGTMQGLKHQRTCSCAIWFFDSLGRFPWLGSESNQRRPLQYPLLYLFHKKTNDQAVVLCRIFCWHIGNYFLTRQQCLYFGKTSYTVKYFETPYRHERCYRNPRHFLSISIVWHRAHLFPYKSLHALTRHMQHHGRGVRRKITAQK